MRCNALLTKHLCKKYVESGNLFCDRHEAQYGTDGTLRFHMTPRRRGHFIDRKTWLHYYYRDGRVCRLQVTGATVTPLPSQDVYLGVQGEFPWYISAMVGLRTEGTSLFISCITDQDVELLYKLLLFVEQAADLYAGQLRVLVGWHVPDAIDVLTRLCDRGFTDATLLTRTLYTKALSELPTRFQRSSDGLFERLLHITTHCGLGDHELVVRALDLAGTSEPRDALVSLLSAMATLRTTGATIDSLILYSRWTIRSIPPPTKQTVAAALPECIPRLVSNDADPLTALRWIQVQSRRLDSTSCALARWIIRQTVESKERDSVAFCLRHGYTGELWSTLEHDVVARTGYNDLPVLVAAGLPLCSMHATGSYATDSLVHRLVKKADDNRHYMEALTWLLENDGTQVHLYSAEHWQSGGKGRPGAGNREVVVETPLHTAIWHRQRRTVQLLLDHEASPYTTDRCRSPIEYAIRRGCTDTLRSLLDTSLDLIRAEARHAGEPLNGFVRTSTFYRRTLEQAIMHYNASDEVLQWIIRYIDSTDVPFRKSSTLVQFAKSQNHPSAIRLLLLNGWEEPPVAVGHPLQIVVNRARAESIRLTVHEHMHDESRRVGTLIGDYMD